MESGNKVLTREQIKEIGDKVVKEWTDRGKLLEGGWQAFLVFGLQNASYVQRTEMRKAYFLGAQHLFASIMNMLDPGAEPTEQDMKRMDLIAKELSEFGKEVLGGMMKDAPQ